MARLDDTRAAMNSCISVLAAVFGQPEGITAKWLDLYYQVRRAYEIERGAEEDPRVMRREDLIPAMREVLRDAAKDEAVKRQRKKTGEAEIVQESTKKPSGWTQYKRKVSGKLADARAAGISIASIAAASAGILGEHRVMDAINAGQLSREEWHALETAIDLATAEAAGK